LLAHNAIWGEVSCSILLIVFLSSRNLKNHKLSGPISPDLGKLEHLRVLYVFPGLSYFYWKLSGVYCISGMLLLSCFFFNMNDLLQSSIQQQLLWNNSFRVGKLHRVAGNVGAAISSNKNFLVITQHCGVFLSYRIILLPFCWLNWNYDQSA
jgi:hypothetical protein